MSDTPPSSKVPPPTPKRYANKGSRRNNTSPEKGGQAVDEFFSTTVLSAYEPFSWVPGTKFDRRIFPQDSSKTLALLPNTLKGEVWAIPANKELEIVKRHRLAHNIVCGPQSIIRSGVAMCSHCQNRINREDAVSFGCITVSEKAQSSCAECRARGTSNCDFGKNVLEEEILDASLASNLVAKLEGLEAIVSGFATIDTPIPPQVILSALGPLTRDGRALVQQLNAAVAANVLDTDDPSSRRRRTAVTLLPSPVLEHGQLTGLSAGWNDEDITMDDAANRQLNTDPAAAAATSGPARNLRSQRKHSQTFEQRLRSAQGSGKRGKSRQISESSRLSTPNDLDRQTSNASGSGAGVSDKDTHGHDQTMLEELDEDGG
ncbi:hypothetical protein TREMEDRAFT_62951 [Tremella mesenterica DSM 1558]|nr:uncharacterized protein TREMEDRAFT_62951 [Tremella mesenterica DSM 1558]EIW69219.1 hypothetical protein TREMEDRAFT_62951 [Tremella mesenterica DSM 1558]